jgi:aryl-alcohol dehydrogenase-like predicted oxidoreductase
MEFRVFGKTGMKVSVLGLGAAEIGYENASVEDVDGIVGSAFDAGVNVFDTAECYGDSESMLGRAVGARRHDILLFTKCGHASGLGGRDWDPDMLARSIERSLRRLRTSYVDLLQLHSCSEAELRRGAVIEVLERAKQAGKARFIGYSGDSTDALYAVQTGRFDTLQTSVNIADQEAITLTIPAAQEGGMGVIAKRAIANAAWKHGTLPPDPYHHTYWRRLDALNYDFLRGGADRGVETALRFTLAVPGVHVAIVGTKNPARWRTNSRIVDHGPLSREHFEQIRNTWSSGAAPDWEGQV